ncbi:helix-turn-helix transcriptional regulator [Pikeienuella piscinae]
MDKITAENPLTGAELRRQRLAFGLSQVELAKRTGLHRSTVKYWERAAIVDLRGHAPKLIFAAIGLNVDNFRTPTRERAGATWGITGAAPMRDQYAGAREEGRPASEPRVAAKLANMPAHRPREDKGANLSSFSQASQTTNAAAELLNVSTQVSPELSKALRPKCGARTRAGPPCRAPVVAGKARCRMHGGLATGARTPEGRERIAEAQRRRWARWRAEQEKPD